MTSAVHEKLKTIVLLTLALSPRGVTGLYEVAYNRQHAGWKHHEQLAKRSFDETFESHACEAEVSRQIIPH